MSQKSIYLPIVFHFHQPVGNFPWVIEDTYKKSYGPLIENMYKYPELKFTLHFSGSLLEWFIDNKPEAIKKVKEMAERDQIEIIGGGFYEPIFAIIPYRDRVAQIKKLSHLIRSKFKVNVQGAWLSERVWEPNYPTFLHDAGLKYVMVDDNHLRSSGITKEETFYSYSTEDEGNIIRIFPINEKLRYLIPWKPTKESVKYLKEVSTTSGERIALFISDAEKMGAWGSTHQFCYVEGKGHQEGDNGKPFVPAFFEQILNNKWIKTITLKKYMNKFSAKNLLYLPTASYDKMEEWVLPTILRRRFETISEEFKNQGREKELSQFLSGGFWRHFLVKYPESNNMHKKMLHVREKLITIEEEVHKLEDKELEKSIEEKLAYTWDEIYKAQCNDSYWHGLFGGVYLQFLRFHVYSNLINAENIIDEIKDVLYPERRSFMSIVAKDFTKNSKKEYLVESNQLNIYVDLSDGGTIYELDYKPKFYNLLNTLTRREEAYHDPERIERGELMIDRFRRSMLRVRFFKNDKTPLEKIEKDSYEELGDFIDGEFKVIKKETDEKKASLILKKQGTIKIPHSKGKLNCELKKSIEIMGNSIDISIEGKINDFKHLNNQEIRGLEEIAIGIDLPFFFNGDPNKFEWDSKDVVLSTQKEKNLLNTFEYSGNNFKAVDKTYDFSLELNVIPEKSSYTIQKFPIIAQLKVEEKYEDVFQGISVLIKKKLTKFFNIQLKINLNHR
jgi:4-alpha-glucanotransferase